jgi:hypothetical protein
MATKYDLEVAVAPDRTAVLLTTLADGREAFGTRLEAPELDDLIRALGDARAMLDEEVAPQLDEGARITNSIVDPNYLVGTNSSKGQTLLAFRHPGFGWIGFQLRRPVVEAMVRKLGQWLEARPR